MQIALVGTTPSRTRAPYDDPAWQIWAHACAPKLIPRADRWFELHTPRVRMQPKAWDPNRPAWVKGRGRVGPIVLQKAVKSVRESLTYPRAEVEQWLRDRGGLPSGPYFSSTLSWMLGLAMYEGATRIGIWGCNFAQVQEYRVQRPCAEYWIGFARGLGIAVDIVETSPLCRSRHVYGFDGPRRDLKKEMPFAPKRLMLAVPGADLPPLTPIPPEIQALIAEEAETYDFQRLKETYGR